MLSMDRRKFLALLGLSALSPRIAFGKLQKQSKEQETLLILLNQSWRPNGQLVAMSRNGKKWKAFDLPMPNKILGAHSIEVHPKDPSLLAIYPFRLDRMVLLSLKEGKVTREIQAKPGYLFSGHGLFTLDGSKILSSEYKEEDAAEGFISVRDVSTGAIMDEIHTGVAHPHQLVSLDPAMKELAIAHYGKLTTSEKRELNSEITYVDFKSKNIVHRAKSQYLNLALCHVAASSRKPGEIYISADNHTLVSPTEKFDSLMATNKYYPAPVLYMNRESTKLQEFDDQGNREHLRFNFSNALSDKHKTFGLVHPDSKRVSFWDTESKRLRKILHYPDHLLTGFNVTPTQDQFFLSATGVKSKLVFFDAKTLHVAEEIVMPMPGHLSAHMAWTRFPIS